MIFAGAATRKTIAVLLVVVVLVATSGTGVASAASVTVPATANTAVANGGATCTYLVVPGDTLFRIALRYGTSVSFLASINGIVNPNRIRSGRILLVPCRPVPPPPPPACTYLVRPGDVLSRIALRFGVTTAYLAAVNHLANPNRIFAWSTLRVPCLDP